MNGKDLYIFIDESGNLNFSPTGTKYFILTAINTLTPLKGRVYLSAYRYKLLRSGINKEYYHATEDEQDVRNKVYDLISKFNDYFVDSVVVQKNRANPSLYKEKFYKGGKMLIKNSGAELYRIVCQVLLRYIFQRYKNSNINHIIVILDAVFTNVKRGIIYKALKSYLKRYFKKPFEIYFHQAKADINCQIADYCGWAIYVKNERNETRPYRFIREKIKSEFQIFERGQKEYYKYKN